MDRLECPFCGIKKPMDVFDPFCSRCGEPMLAVYPRLARRFHLERALSIEKYREYLPIAHVDKKLSLGEGGTPLVPLERLRRKWSLPPLFAKNETINPTQSFKDRGTAVAVQRAVALGIRKIGTVSTGNMAASTAAYGAKAGLGVFIFLKEDSTPEKIGSTGIHGAVLFKVKGDYGKLFAKSYEIGRRHGIFFINSVDPLRIEGYKVTGYEIYGQLDNKPPRFLFCPVSSGGHLIGLMRAFLDLREDGIIRNLPIFVGVQAAGCAPLARAFARGDEKFRRVMKTDTIAHAISNPSPPAGNLLLKWLRETGGMLIQVTDREILAAQRDLAAMEGIFADPASATTLAGLIKLSKKQHIRLRGEIVLVITGSGLKAMETLKLQNILVQAASLTALEKLTRLG
jgi:threonine synthase